MPEPGVPGDRRQHPRGLDGPVPAVIPASDRRVVRAAEPWFTRPVVTAPGRRC